MSDKRRIFASTSNNGKRKPRYDRNHDGPRRTDYEYVGAGDNNEYLDDDDPLDQVTDYNNAPEADPKGPQRIMDPSTGSALSQGWKFLIATVLIVVAVVAALVVWNIVFTHNTEDALVMRIEIVDANITTLDTDIQNVNTTTCAKIAVVASDLAALEGTVTTIQGDITTIQNVLITHGTDIMTLQSDVTTLQSDVSTLQLDVNTAESDIIALQNKDMQLMDTDAAQQVQIDVLLSSGMMLLNDTMDLNMTLLQLISDVELNAMDIATLQTDVAGKVSSVSGGTAISITGTAVDPIVNWASGISGLSDVDTTGVMPGETLTWSGAQWLPAVLTSVPPNILKATVPIPSLSGPAGTPTVFGVGYTAIAPILGTDAAVVGGVVTINVGGVYEIILSITLDGAAGPAFGASAEVVCVGFPACGGATFSGPAALAERNTITFLTPAYARDHTTIFSGHDVATFGAGDTVQVVVTAGVTALMSSSIQLLIKRIG